MSNLATVLIGLGAISGAGVAVGAWSSRSRDKQVMVGVHAGQDDHARDPLAVPLRTGCASFEVGVWLDAAGRLQVGATRWDRDPGNAIGPSVLRPLADRFERLGGRIYAGQREPVLLMVELLEADPIRLTTAYDALEGVLRRYAPMLTRLADGAVHPGAVTVLLTGTGVPRHLVAARIDRYAFVDGNVGDVGAWGAPADLVPVVSEHLSWRFGWDGTEEMPVEERHLLREIVRAAHADGRRLRFFGIPERPARSRDGFWRELTAAGVDLITAADPAAVVRHLRKPSVPARRFPVPGSWPVSGKPAGRESTAGDGARATASAR